MSMITNEQYNTIHMKLQKANNVHVHVRMCSQYNLYRVHNIMGHCGWEWEIAFVVVDTRLSVCASAV